MGISFSFYHTMGGGSFPVIEDINNDGINEIIVSLFAEYGRIYAMSGINHDTVWGFKDDTLFFTGVAVDDVDGDGLNEVIFGADKLTGTPTILFPSMF